MLALTIQGSTEYLDEGQQEQAMSRYWKARQQGDATAALVKVDVPPEPAPCAPGTMSNVAKTRIQAQEILLSKAGFALAPPLFAAGTRVLPLGDENFRLERQRVDALPMYADAVSDLAAVVRAEDRRDIDVPLRDLRMDDMGQLLVLGEVHHVTEDAFHQLMTVAGIGIGARYLAGCPGDLRATNVNRQAQHQRNRTVRLRTRGNTSQRAVFAVVTTTYTAVDTERVVEAVVGLLRDAHAEVVYDGTGAQVTALFMPDEIVDLAAGDVFKTGVRISTDDTGRGRIRVEAVAFRNRCLNLIVIGEGTVETVSAVHKGDPTRILDTVMSGVDDARGKIGDFLAAWGHARTVEVDVPDTFRRWVDERKLGPIPSRDRDQAVETLLTSWQTEPGGTLADAVNAVTRSAHESDWWTRDLRRELEQRAASLVLVPR